MTISRAVDDTFCILVLGDFLGTGAGGLDNPDVHWIPRRATPDTVMELTGLRPRMRVSREILAGEAAVGGGTGEGEMVELDSLQDFEADALFQKLDLFQPFREARDAARRGDPAPWGPDSQKPESLPGQEKEGSGSTVEVPDPASGGLLDAILDATEPSSDSPASAPGSQEELEAFIRDAVRPHLVPDDRDAKSRVAALDETISRHLSRLLHTRSFQGLESIWRCVAFLLSRAESSGKIRVFLAHVPRGVLEEDLVQENQSGGSRLLELLSTSPGGVSERRWALALATWGFRPQEEDADLAAELARVAQVADVPILADAVLPGASGTSGGGEPAETLQEGLSVWPESWRRLRRESRAAWLGLVYPRILLREPGTGSGTTGKKLDFHEGVASWSDLLWGSGSVFLAALLAQGFSQSGWGFSPERHLELGGLPLGAPSDVGTESPRSLESSLNPAGAQRLMEAGIMPLVGFPHKAGARIGGVFSVADPVRALAGWWIR